MLARQFSQLPTRSASDAQLSSGYPTPIVPAPISPQVQVNPAKPLTSHQDQLAMRLVLVGGVLFSGALCVLAGALMARSKPVTPVVAPSPSPSPSPAVIVIPAPPSTPDRGGCQLLCFGG
jgi:hypothetical protein